VEVRPSCEESAHPFLELMPRDPHDRAAMTWRYQLPVHHPRGEEEVVVEAVLRPEVEVVVAEVAAVVLHHHERAGAVEAVEVVEAAGVQG
jgi:hypothetical protein